MKNQPNNGCGKCADNISKPVTPNQVAFVSNDGLVEMGIFTKGLKRWPDHGGPVVLIRLRTQKHTRVQLLPDGRTEIAFRNDEVIAHLKLLNQAKAAEMDFPIPPAHHKPEWRRRYWHSRNAERVRQRESR